MELLKNTGGRPVKVLTKEQVDEVEHLARAIPKYMLADYFGMTDKTFRAVEQRQPEVSTAYKKGRAMAIADVAQTLVSQALDGNIRAAMFYLKTQAGWSETKTVEVATPHDTQWTIRVMD